MAPNSHPDSSLAAVKSPATGPGDGLTAGRVAGDLECGGSDSAGIGATSGGAPTTISAADRGLIDFLRCQGASTISELVGFAGVTATAIRQRLNRLMEQGLVARQAEAGGRGRPTHRYSLTSAGVQSGGNNYEDLAGVLWSEIRAVENPDVRHRLLKRIVGRLAEVYRAQMSGGNLHDRMESLVRLMQQRDVPFEVTPAEDGQLPVLTALACPYPDLAEQDRSICSMEKMLFSEILGQGVKLTACRLDGETCCTFEASANSVPAV